MDKLSGITFPAFGKRVFTEDWDYEQESKSQEILNRDKDLLGTGFQSGGSIAVGANPATVDLIEETIIYDAEGRRFTIPPIAGIAVPLDTASTIIARHKFEEEEFTSPSNLPSDGPIIHRSNGYEILARQGSLASGDIPLRALTTDDEGLVTLGDDLRVFKGLLGKNIKDNQIQDKHLHPDIKTGNLSELDSALIAEINPDESNPLKWVKAINKVFEMKQALEQRVVSLEATQVPLGSTVNDDLNMLSSERYVDANAQQVNRSALDPLLLSALIKNVTSINTGTDRVNVAAHGKSEGDLVKFAFTGGGITALTHYYVRNPTANDFQISTGPATAIIDLTSDQTGEMLTHVGWGFGNGSTTINVLDDRGIVEIGAGIHGTRAMATGGNYNGGPVGFEGRDEMQAITGSVSSVRVGSQVSSGALSYNNSTTSDYAGGSSNDLRDIQLNSANSPNVHIGHANKPATTARRKKVRIK